MSKDGWLNIAYEISDGYVGGKRPQSCRVHIDAFDDCADEIEIVDRIYEVVTDDMMERIEAVVERPNEIALTIRDMQKARAE